MQVRVVTDAPGATHARALVLPVFSDAGLVDTGSELNADLHASLKDVIASGEMKGKLAETTLVHAHGQPFERVLLVGLGEKQKFEQWMLARYAGTAVRQLGRRGLREVAFAVPPGGAGSETADVSFLVEGAIAGGFDTTVYQKDPDKRSAIDAMILVAAPKLDKAAIEAGVERGRILGEAVNFARTLAITPANDMTPTRLAERAVEECKAAGVDTEVLDANACRELGMGSFLSVAQGSAEPPKFIVMRYNGDPSSKEVLALVGKGITFDTGGISLKPPERMEEMKYDMSGGAGVIATMTAVGKLQPKVNVIGIVPATENMPGGKATKPGDIFTAMNGKTIEVINTDAEGRLILADGLCYAAKEGATRIVDVATLTGACVIALGHAASAVIGNDEAFIQQFLGASKPSGERYWHMPLYDDYSAAMKSDIADLKNTGGRPAGTLTAAAFLKAFVAEKTPWIHVDIAGTAYLDNESAWQAKGPTGTPVRAFVSFIEQLAGSPVIHTNGVTAGTHATV